MISKDFMNVNNVVLYLAGILYFWDGEVKCGVYKIYLEVKIEI